MERSLQHSAAYLFASPGASESSTDLVYSGCLAIADGGGLAILGEGELGDADCSLVRDVDLEVLEIERGRRAPVSQSNNILALESVCVAFDPSGELPDLLSSFFNNVNPLPYAPRNTGENDGYEEAVLRMQSNALATRMRNSGVHRLVLGVSGGLDSTLALLVCVRALKILKLPLENLHCITMPGFGTSARSRANARKLCQYLGVALERIDIKAMCSRQLAALGHDGVTPDATFENVQARMRTSILMNKANTLNALVVGTGDMSELALGWCTYGGDQMSHYAINANIPKTLVRALIEWSRSMVREEPLGKVLKDILKAPISPELLPLGEDGEIKQETEGILGAYELHDFFLYHTLNHGFSKYKIYLLAINAFSGWFSREEILETLTTFIKRFSMQQFKRSAMPDGPAIFSASLSPRTGLRMPSDATVVWPCGVQEGV
jgi:NAD+ synthase (glutamine-hydrolysing)